MGQDLGALYLEVEDEVSWLHKKWGEFQELFGKEQRIDLLNEVASSFFYLVQQLLWESLLLQLCRLTDPPGAWGSDLKQKVRNCSLQLLADLIPDPSLKARVEAATQTILGKCEFTRPWRNRRLAHSDLMTRRGLQPLPDVDAKKIEDALASIRDLHGLLGEHYGHPPPRFPSNIGPWGAESLLHYLEKGVRTMEEERERWRILAESKSDLP